MKRSGFKNGPYKGFKAKPKPMRREAVKARQRRLETTSEWDKANPPDLYGHWHCYIPKHQLCPRILTEKTLVREHDLSKARRPDLKHDITNMYPACSYDNKAKGSMSAEEYMNA